MSFERLGPSDRRLIVAAIVVTVASSFYVAYNYRAAFPQASIELRYSKDEITQKARDFLAARGFSTEGFRNLTLFDPDNQARLYLERELGLEEANRLMAGEVSVWRWRARWFKPPEKEELRAYLSPDGHIVGFQHVIAEAEQGARLEEDQARGIAEQFLRSQSGSPHNLVESRVQERPNRLDYVFTWEREDFRAKEATYRRTIVIQGDEVGRYSEYLHVPEQWQRDFAALRSSNELFQWIAEAFYVPLIVAAILLLIQYLRRHTIPWRALILLCAAVGILTIVAEVNSLPFFVDGMPTSSPLSQTLLFGLLQALGAGVGVFFYVILAAAPGEPLYRKSQPANMSFRAIVSRNGFRTREFFRAVVSGYAFAAAHIAFVVAFYLIGRRFGVWSPQDLEYSDLLSTAVPWIYPLAISVLASTSEEFWFRLLAIPLVKRVFGSTWFAVVLPAFVWGFLHSNYPQQPGFVRGIEVGIIGVAAGFLMFRCGILSTLIWHYTVDAVFIGTFLFQSESLYFQLSGLIVAGVVLLPLLVSLFFYKRNRGFLTQPELLNLADPVPEASPAPAVEAPAEPLSAKLSIRWLWIACAVAAAALVVVQPMQFGDFIKVSIDSKRAAEIADEAMRDRRLDLGEWRRVTTFIDNLSTASFEYVRRLEGSEVANKTVEARTFTGVWGVRYLKPMESEAWWVFVNQQGEAYRVDHVLDEDAAGAQLPPEEARRIAETHLSQSQGVEIAEYRLVDSSEEKHDHRTDHEFVWEDKDFRIGETTARISISVVGDDASYYRRILKLPEEWLREFQKPRLQAFIIPALAGGVGLPLLIILIRRMSSRDEHNRHHYRWKLYAGAAGVAAALSILSALNQAPTWLASYDTAEPLENFYGQLALFRLSLVLMTALGFFLLALAADVFLQLAAGYRRVTPPSLIRTVVMAVTMGGTLRAVSWAGYLVPGDRYSLPLWSIEQPVSVAPAFAVLSQSFLLAVAALATVLIVTAAAVRFLCSRNGYIIGGGMLVLVAIAQATNVLQWGFQLVAGAAVVGLIWLLVRSCGVDLVGFGVALFWLQAASLGLTLAEQPATSLRVNGIVALAAAALIGVLVVWLSARTDQSKNASPGLR